MSFVSESFFDTHDLFYRRGSDLPEPTAAEQKAPAPA